MPLEPIPIEVEPQPFELQLEVFAGPLDLLLQLIESRQLDVLTVPLAEMADAYVEHLANHPVPADELADFVAIASQLILLKSRRLLPGEPLPAGLVAEEEPDEDELRRRLIEYRALRDALAPARRVGYGPAGLPPRAARGRPAGGSQSSRCRPCSCRRRWSAWRPSPSRPRHRRRSCCAR